MPFSRTEGSIKVAVDAYVQSDRQQEFFEANLNKFGILPVYIVLENRGKQKFVVRRATTALEVPDGRTLAPIESTIVANMLARTPHELRKTTAGGLCEGGQGGGIGVIAVALICIPILLAVNSAEKSATAARTADYWNKEFQDAELSKDDFAYGLLYFQPPPGTLWYTKSKLMVQLVNKEDMDSTIIRVPLGDSAFFPQ